MENYIKPEGRLVLISKLLTFVLSLAAILVVGILGALTIIASIDQEEDNQ